MPLAKSAPSPVTKTSSRPLAPPTTIFTQEETPHIEFYRFFGVNPIDGNEQLDKVYKWTNEKSNSISDVLRKTRTLEGKLGAPKLGETRLTKLFNWIRLSENINSLRESMGDEIGTVTTRSKQEISRIKEGQLPELERLNSQI